MSHHLTSKRKRRLRRRLDLPAFNCPAYQSLLAAAWRTNRGHCHKAGSGNSTIKKTTSFLWTLKQTLLERYGITLTTTKNISRLSVQKSESDSRRSTGRQQKPTSKR